MSPLYGVQVHGGMGFIEETGAAQSCRDARILTICGSTTAIQANDLVGRKTVRDGGAVAISLIAQMRQTAAKLAGRAGANRAAIGRRPSAAAETCAIEYVVTRTKDDPRAVYAGSVNYLKPAGVAHDGR